MKGTMKGGMKQMGMPHPPMKPKGGKGGKGGGKKTC